MARELRITNNRLNSYKFRVLSSGIDLSQFLRNPILLWNHNRPWRGTQDEVLPIGRIENLRIEGDDIIGTPVFDESDAFALKIKNKWDAGFLKMGSAGLEPIETSSDLSLMLPGQTRPTVTKSKLLEVSITDIGSNDDALQLCHEGKYITLSTMADAILPEIQTQIQTNTDSNMKIIALKLGLPEAATETEILARIGEIQARANESTNLSQKLDELHLSNVTRMVDEAVAGKKITADKRDQFITLGKTAGVDMLKTTLDSIMPAVKPTQTINPGSGLPKEGYTKLSEVPEEQILELRSGNKAEYIRLFKAEYGVEPNLD